MSIIAEREGRKRAYGVAAATTITQGLAYVLASGLLAAPAQGATAHKAGGIATFTVDNSNGAAGALRAEVVTGEHKFHNAGDVVAADAGSTAYLTSGDTVTAEAGAAPNLNPIAGTITQVDTDGVWVDVGV